MVERTDASFDEFEGIVENIEEVENTLSDSGKQYKITIATDISKSGYMYEWINVSSKATETSVPEGSNLDKFLQELEMIHSEVKKEAKILDALKIMVAKKYLWKKKKLGRSFDGKEAKDFWIPVKEL